jgi:hypothetical protein
MSGDEPKKTTADKSLADEDRRMLEEQGIDALLRFFHQHEAEYDRILEETTAKKKKTRRKTLRPDAKIGENQSLVLLLLREHSKGFESLLEEFTCVLYRQPVHPEQRTRAKFLFLQTLRTLKARHLLTNQAEIATLGRNGKTMELTERARERDLAYDRKPVALEDVVIKIVNDAIARGNKHLTTRYVLNELDKKKITGLHVNSTSVGRVLHRYGLRRRTEKGSIYIFSHPVSRPAVEKNLKKNWKKRKRFVNLMGADFSY